MVARELERLGCHVIRMDDLGIRCWRWMVKHTRRWSRPSGATS
ncbi:MAG: hypothetical protein WDO18_14665 [Acidobacteriota bacterium]